MTYFERYAHEKELFPDYMPDKNTSVIVTLPSFREEATHLAVSSLCKCTAPKGLVAVLVLVNQSEEEDEPVSAMNAQTMAQLKALETPDWLELKIAFQKLPHKRGGVGLARKIAMDEACRWFRNIDRPDGIIVCFDADATCSENFLCELERAFESRKLWSAITFFEHPTNHKAIILYELYLRYYVDGLRYAGFAYAHQTLGSCISVRSFVYRQQGGMNTRKAGEDFYFLQKIIPAGSFGEINSATIFPSGRVSDRVPFGTGNAVEKIRRQANYSVYNPESFELLKQVFGQMGQWYTGATPKLCEELQSFHKKHEFDLALQRMLSHSRFFDTFRKHFLRWWDAFKILKFVHYLRDEGLAPVTLEEAILRLDAVHWKLQLKGLDPKGQLLKIRTFDRGFQTK